MARHALLSPSASARWIACPGSVLITKDMPNEPSPYAEEGTRAHAEAERIIRAYLKGAPLPDSVPEFPELGQYLRYVERLREDGAFVIPESRVSVEGITTETGAKGTADLIALLGDTLEIVDLKWGAGVPVEAENNTQMAIYAMAALDAYEYLGPFENVRMTICQPRVNEAPVTWTITVDELNELRAKIREAAVRALLQADGSLTPTFGPTKEGCRFCKARGSCAAYAKMAHEISKVDFPELGDEPILPPEVRAEIFFKLDAVRAWVESFESQMLEEALAGKRFPGIKLVKARAGARKWKDEQEADDLLAATKLPPENRYESKLISPTSAEKLWKAGLMADEEWDKLKEVIIRPEPKTILAPASDKRAEVFVDQPKDMFDNLN